MSATVAVWSKVLQPGQDALVSEDVTVQITNITLEVDEKAKSEKRSVLKMQHLEADPRTLQFAAFGYDPDMDEADSDFDSDEEDDDDDDEDDDEEMAAADASKVSKASTSSKKSAGKVNGKASAEEEDEDDEDEDDMDDFDEDDLREETEVQICSLLPNKVEQYSCNLVLPAGEDFVFKLSGDYKVHLFGHYIVEPNPLAQSAYHHDDDSDDEEITSDEDSEGGIYDPETGLLMDYDDDESDDDEEEDDSRFMELETSPKKKDEKALPAPAAAEKKEVPASDIIEKGKLSKNQLKKLLKKEKAAEPEEAKPAAKKEESKKPESKKAEEPKEEAKKEEPVPAKKAPSKKITTPSGLIIEDNKAGTGPAAKSGNRVTMRYIGRLQNGKIFDQNTKGAPFGFKLGKGEVIKGWDEGIQGMQVGGERKLTIPAKLAYGKQAISGIPPNSTLIFEVKLLSVKN